MIQFLFFFFFAPARLVSLRNLVSLSRRATDVVTVGRFSTRTDQSSNYFAHSQRQSYSMSIKALTNSFLSRFTRERYGGGLYSFIFSSPFAFFSFCFNLGVYYTCVYSRANGTNGFGLVVTPLPAVNWTKSRKPPLSCCFKKFLVDFEGEVLKFVNESSPPSWFRVSFEWYILREIVTEDGPVRLDLKESAIQLRISWFFKIIIVIVIFFFKLPITKWREFCYIVSWRECFRELALKYIFFFIYSHVSLFIIDCQILIWISRLPSLKRIFLVTKQFYKKEKLLRCSICSSSEWEIFFYFQINFDEIIFSFVSYNKLLFRFVCSSYIFTFNLKIGTDIFNNKMELKIIFIFRVSYYNCASNIVSRIRRHLWCNAQGVSFEFIHTFVFKTVIIRENVWNKTFKGEQILFICVHNVYLSFQL